MRMATKRLALGPEGIQQLSKLLKALYIFKRELFFTLKTRCNPKGNAFIEGSLNQASIGPGLPTKSIEKDSLTIQVLKRPNPKIAVLRQIRHF
jgi:hypothetical protein